MRFTVLFLFLRLTGDLSIQMVTALVLQLIQSSVKIPENSDDMQDEAEDDENKPRVSCANVASGLPVVLVLDRQKK